MTATNFEPSPVARQDGGQSRIGVVVIGRNEGERLHRCLASVLGRAELVVYVDSGSTDGSIAAAQSMGAAVVGLDTTLPFTAARARNEGLRVLRQLAPVAAYVQFVDGDCELAAGWIERACAFHEAHPCVGAVCGRLREKFPERTIYNRMCDMEWDTPIGPARSCGGIALMRVAALVQVGGFRAGMIAGEEPELCVRLRANGWQVWRLDEEMALHDAAMIHFSQWLRRSMRAGFAFAEGAHLHGAPPERHWVRESRSAWFWGLALPVALLLLALVWPPSLLGFLAYPLHVLRLFLTGSGAWKPRLARAFFLVLGKFAEAAGQGRFVLQRLRGGPAQLIEYK